MAGRSARGVLVGASVVAGLVALVGLLMFLQTADPLVLLVAVLVPMALLKATWVALDARRVGLPPLPWAAVAFLVPVVGLLAYLVVRGRGPAMV